MLEQRHCSGVHISGLVGACCTLVRYHSRFFVQLDIKPTHVMKTENKNDAYHSGILTEDTKKNLGEHKVITPEQQFLGLIPGNCDMNYFSWHTNGFPDFFALVRHLMSLP